MRQSSAQASRISCGAGTGISANGNVGLSVLKMLCAEVNYQHQSCLITTDKDTIENDEHSLKQRKHAQGLCCKGFGEDFTSASAACLPYIQDA